MKQRAIFTLDQYPFSPFIQLNKEIEKEFMQNFEKAQYFETDDAYLASMDIPGVNSAEINIEIEEDRLIVSAERKSPFDKTGKIVKKYSQVFMLPKNIEQDKINAHYENGVLCLTIPKSADQKTKKIIEVSTGQKPKSWSHFLNFSKKEEVKTIN